MKLLKWIAITLILTILVYAVIAAIITFLWAIYIGAITACIVIVILACIRFRKWLNREK